RRCQAQQCPMEKYLYSVKRKTDQWGQQEHYVDRIGKTLLILRIIGPGWIQHAAVVALLYFDRDVAGIGVAVVQQQFARPQPTRIEIGQIAPWTLARRRI